MDVTEKGPGVPGKRTRKGPGVREDEKGPGAEKPFIIPRILVAGTHSGCGKTTIARGLMQALVSRGLVVQPFKVGPDFIDPTYHTVICRRPSRNLDPYMMGNEGVRETFVSASRGADIAIIEGVMGMFDGLDGTMEASSSHVAELLMTPVLLVVDVKGMSVSANALVRGFSQFDSAGNIAGVIFNRIGSERHRTLIDRSRELPVMGWVKRRDSLHISSRHLGLHMAAEVPFDNAAGEAMMEDCDIGAILEIARKAPPLKTREGNVEGLVKHPVIGIARDEAFCFYYQDNLDRLSGSGASLVFFSPIHDRLPDIDALYLGGGYPELHAEVLGNSVCRTEIRAAADAGMPIYGECGGLLFLSGSITAGRSFRMAGVLPAEGEMTGSLQALGYSHGICIRHNTFLHQGTEVRGHEFHYSRLDCSPDARFLIRLERGKGISGGLDGLSEHETVGSYTHSYFSDRFAVSLVRAAARYRKQ